MRLGVERDGPECQFGDGHIPGSTAVDVERPANAVRLVRHERAVDIPSTKETASGPSTHTASNVERDQVDLHAVVGSPSDHLWIIGPAAS